jgi:hypothetical protein
MAGGVCGGSAGSRSERGGHPAMCRLSAAVLCGAFGLTTAGSGAGRNPELPVRSSAEIGSLDLPCPFIPIPPTSGEPTAPSVFCSLSTRKDYAGSRASDKTNSLHRFLPCHASSSLSSSSIFLDHSRTRTRRMTRTIARMGRAFHHCSVAAGYSNDSGLRRCSVRCPQRRQPQGFPIAITSRSVSEGIAVRPGCISHCL